VKREQQITAIRLEFLDIKDVLDERSLRWWCASKVRAYKREQVKGGVSIVSEATGISRSRIYRGLQEIEGGLKLNKRIRQLGGGRKKNNRDSTQSC